MSNDDEEFDNSTSSSQWPMLDPGLAAGLQGRYLQYALTGKVGKNTTPPDTKPSRSKAAASSRRQASKIGEKLELPPVPKAQLEKWMRTIPVDTSIARGALPELACAYFSKNSVSRDRVLSVCREIYGAGKRGPKRFRG